MSRFYVVQLMCAALSIAGCCHANAANVYPTDSLPQNYMFGESHAAPLPVEDEWWKSFGDSTLDSLISVTVCQCFQYNPANRQ